MRRPLRISYAGDAFAIVVHDDAFQAGLYEMADEEGFLLFPKEPPPTPLERPASPPAA